MQLSQPPPPFPPRPNQEERHRRPPSTHSWQGMKQNPECREETSGFLLPALPRPSVNTLEYSYQSMPLGASASDIAAREHFLMYVLEWCGLEHLQPSKLLFLQFLTTSPTLVLGLPRLVFTSGFEAQDHNTPCCVCHRVNAKGRDPGELGRRPQWGQRLVALTCLYF